MRSRHALKQRFVCFVHSRAYCVFCMFCLLPGTGVIYFSDDSIWGDGVQEDSGVKRASSPKRTDPKLFSGWCSCHFPHCSRMYREARFGVKKRRAGVVSDYSYYLENQGLDLLLVQVQYRLHCLCGEGCVSVMFYEFRVYQTFSSWLYPYPKGDCEHLHDATRLVLRLGNNAYLWNPCVWLRVLASIWVQKIPGGISALLVVLLPLLMF